MFPDILINELCVSQILSNYLAKKLHEIETSNF